MAILTSPSGAFPISLVYITLGTIIDIWTIVAMVYYPPETSWDKFWIVGFMVTGFALLVIGLLLGPIGRAARHAELPPSEVTSAVSSAEQIAAGNPPPVVVPGTAPVAPGPMPGTPGLTPVAAGTTPVVQGTAAAPAVSPVVSPPTVTPHR